MTTSNTDQTELWIKDQLRKRLNHKPPRNPHLINGVQFSPQDSRRIELKTIRFEGIMGFRNIEQRRTAIEFLGIENLIKNGDFFLLDQSERGNALFSTRRAFTNDEPFSRAANNQRIFFLHYTCPSTKREYVSSVSTREVLDALPSRSYASYVNCLMFLRANNNKKTAQFQRSLNGIIADTAMAWKLNLTLEEYRTIEAEA